MKLIYLEWEDAVDGETGWQHEENVDGWANDCNFLVKQVGFVFKEDKHFLCLVGGFSEDEVYQPQYHQLLKIPKGWIRKRVDLSKYIKE